MDTYKNETERYVHDFDFLKSLVKLFMSSD